MTTEREESRKAFEELDPADVDAAIELGTDICKEMGICCGEKGTVIYRIYQKMKALKAKEAAAAPPAEPAPAAEQPPRGKLEVLKEKTEEGGEE